MERRWSHDLVTKLRVEVPLRFLDDAYDEIIDAFNSFDEVALKPWAEVRLRLRDFFRGSLLRLTLRGSFMWIDWLEEGPGAERAWEASSSLYLDWEKAGSFILRLGVIYTRHKCEEMVGMECRSYHAVLPSIKAIARF